MSGKKFLYYPVFLFFVLIGIDSLFRLPYVQLLAKLDLTAINYKAKKDLLQTIIDKKDEIQNQPNKKLMIVLGSSRLLYFDHKELQSFYPDWEIYNLSSAVTTPAYYDYQLTKLLDAGIRPDLIVMETDPNQFNQNSVFKSSNLTYSFDFLYVLENLDLFGKDHFSFFLGRTLFAVGTFKPYLDQMWRNFRNPNLENFRGMYDSTYNHILTNNGHGLSPIDDYVEKDANSLQLTSHRTLDWLFASYVPSKMQYGFYEKILSRIQKEKIKTIVIWPTSSPNFEALMEKEPLVSEWERSIDSLSAKYEQTIFKLKKDPSYSCNAFADGGHVAKECYRTLMRSILLEYFRRFDPACL